MLLTGCNNQPDFRIDGKVPNNSYDGEWIYLVPMVNAPVERVDSTVIKNGRFVFESDVETPEIYIIRGRPKIRLTLQELLVVKEPGEVQVSLSKESSAGGTALNDSLQQWKEKKLYYDSHLLALRKALKTATEPEIEMLTQKIDSLTIEHKNYDYQFALNNRNNVVGQMIIRLRQLGFTPEQRKKLEVD